MVIIERIMRLWRVIVLGLLVVAILGPWSFSTLPADFCPDDYIRLEPDFCGKPLPGIMVTLGMFAGFFVASISWLISGATSPPIGLLDVAFFMTLPIPLLPFISMIALLTLEDPGNWEIYHLVGFGLAIGASLFIGLHSDPGLFWLKWGVWLYAAVGVVSLIGEVVGMRFQVRSLYDRLNHGTIDDGNIYRLREVCE